MSSHDRRFLERLSRRTVWMDRGQTRELDQGFGAFEDWRDKLIEEEELEQHKLGRQIAREQHWIVHGVSGRRKRNVRRVKELAALRKTHKEHRSVQGGMSATVVDAQKSGKSVVRMENVTKGFDGRTIVDDFSIKINRGERIGVIGPNGSGKTTLLKLIMGKLEADTGRIDDEPTNDLDLETLDLLQELVADYNGTVLIVSHDRDFLDRTVTRAVGYEGDGQWQVYAGGYSDMVAQRGEGVTARRALDSSGSGKATAKKSANKNTPLDAQASAPKEALAEIQDKLDTLELEWLELSEMQAGAAS